MLNILKIKLNKNYKNFKEYNKTSYLNKIEPNVRHWKNSIYTFNKNSLNLIPEASKLTTKLIESYFSLCDYKLVKIINKTKNWKKIYKKRIYSTNKVFISKGLFKHTNDLVNINIYFYNRLLPNYKKKISERYKFFFKNYFIKKKLKLIKRKSSRFLKIDKKRNIILNGVLKYKIYRMYNIENYKKVFTKIFLKKSLKKILLYIYYRQLIFINESKFNNYYLHGLINLIKKIYKKNIFFNFINVKYFFNNTDIFIESLSLKIRKNRLKVLTNLKGWVSKMKINVINNNLKEKYQSKDLKIINNTDITNTLLYDILLEDNTKFLKKIVYNNINYKRVTGIKLHLGGRLTKRNTAARALSKTEFKGNLVNLYSSKYGKSSSLLRGGIKPNIDYSNLNSKIRTGTFGLKGWIGGQ